MNTTDFIKEQLRENFREPKDALNLLDITSGIDIDVTTAKEILELFKTQYTDASEMTALRFDALNCPDRVRALIQVVLDELSSAKEILNEVQNHFDGLRKAT